MQHYYTQYVLEVSWYCIILKTSIFHSFTQHRNTVLPQIINIDSSLSLSIKLFDALTDVKKNVKCPTQTLTVCHIP